MITFPDMEIALPKPIKTVKPVRQLNIWFLVGLTTLAQILLMIVIAAATGTLETELSWKTFDKQHTAFLPWMTYQIPTVVIQQVLLFKVVIPVCLKIVKRPWAAASLGSVIFALCHFPNPFLTIVCFPLALIWYALYAQGKTLYPLMVSHFILVLATRFFLPSHVHMNLAVGKKAMKDLREAQYLYQNGLYPKVRHYSSLDYYRASGNTPEGFMTGLYADLLGRKEIGPAFDEWVLNMPLQPRDATVIEFLVSPEYRTKNNLQ